MKKLLLIPVLFAFLLTSCDKDKDEKIDPPVSVVDAKMRGDWTNTLIKRVYYSIDDEVMFTDSVQYQTTFSFDGKRLTVTAPGASPEVMSYSFPDPEDSTVIELQRGSDKGKYTVKSISESVMTWVEEKAWAGFPEEASESEKTTSKLGVYTWRFDRKSN